MTFDMEEVQVIPEQTAIGYIDGGFIGSFEHMLKMILYRNPETYNIRDGAYHMMDPVGDILNSIEHQASAMISVTVNDKGEMFLREADPMSIISPNTPASLLAHVFRKNVNYGNLSSVRKEFVDGMLPNTRSVIVFKDAGSLKLVTRFSMREFLVHTRRISIEGYLKTFHDPFMQSLATDKLYDCRYYVNPKTAKNRTITYYGRDKFTDSILIYGDTAHYSPTYYVGAAHRAFTYTCIDTYAPYKKLMEEYDL